MSKLEWKRGIAPTMWVMKRKEGSINYIVSWAIVVLLLIVGLFCIILALRYFVTGEVSLLVPGPNIATTLVAAGTILVTLSLFLFLRQIHLLNRLTELRKVMNNVRSGMRLAESMGIDIERVEEHYRQAETQVGFQKLKDTENIMADCSTTLESLLTLHTDKLLEKTRADLERKRETIGIDFSGTSLAPIQKEIEGGDYWEVSRLLRSHSIASRRLEELWTTMGKAESLGLPVDEEKEKLESALTKFNEGNLSEARIESIKTRDALDYRIRKYVKERYVSPVYRKIALMTRRGITSEDAQRLVNEAGTSLLAANMENSIEMASLGERKINEVTKAGIESSLDKIENISTRAESLGLDVSVYASQIEDAKEDFNEGRLEESLDGLGQVGAAIVRDMNNLVLDRFHELKRSIDMLFLVPEAKLEFVNALEKADEERRNGHFEEAIGLAEKLSERVREEEGESLRTYEGSAEKLKEKIEELGKKGVPTEGIQEELSVSEQIASEGDYARAMEIVLQATEMADRNLALYKDSVRTLEEVSTLLNRTREKGVEITDLSERLVDLESSSDLEGVIAEAKHIEEEALQRMTDLTERTKIELMKMRDQLKALLEEGIDVGAVPDLLEIAQQELENEDFSAAQKTLANATKDIERALNLSEAFEEALSEFSEAVTLLEMAGVPTSVFESDLQNIITKKDEDSLEEVYKLLDELRSEGERIKKQARETIEGTRALIEDNPDIDLTEETGIVEKASSAFEDRRYGKAFEIAVEALGRTQKKVKVFEKSGELLERIGVDLERLAGTGFDAHTLESELQLCEMERDPAIRIEKTRALESKVARTERRLRESMEWAIVEARHGLSILKRNNVSSDDLAEMLESAEELASNQVYREAEKKARNVRDLAEERRNQYREAEERLADLESVMRKAEELEISVEDFEEDLSWLKRSDDYSRIIERAGLMYDEVNNLLEGKRESIRSTISSIRDSLGELEHSNVSAPAVREILEKAELELSEDSIVEAIESCNLAEERLKEVRASYDNWVEVASSVEESLREAESAGIGVKDFLARLEELKASSDYDSAASEVDRILDDLDARKTVMSTRTLEDIQKTREKVNSLIEEGVQGEPLIDYLKEAERFVQEESYLSARQKVLEVSRALEGLRGAHEEFMAALNEAKARIEQVEASGLDVAEFVSELEKLKESEMEYDHRTRIALQLAERAARMGTNLEEETSRSLSEAAELLEKARAEGARTEDAEDMLSRAHERLGEGNLVDARRLALEAKEIAEQMRAVRKEREAETARAREAIEKAAIWGVDVSDLMKELDEAASVSDDYDALQELHAIVEEADSARLSLSEGITDKLEGAKEEIDRLRSDGARVSALEDAFKAVEEAVEGGRSAEARERIEALEEQISRLEDLHSDYTVAKKELEDEMADLELRKDELKGLKEEMRMAEETEDYEEAIQKLLGLSGKVIRLRREMKESAESKVKEVRGLAEELANEGVDVEDALSVLYEAEEVLDDGGYLRAVAKANRAAEILEGLDKRISFENELLETEDLLRTANEEGIDVGDLMDRLESLRDGKDYEEMADALRFIKEETNKRRKQSPI